MSATKKIIGLSEIVIKRDFNARVMFDDQRMEELKKSILKSGLRLPITVKKIKLTEKTIEQYEIWRAGEKLEVPPELIGKDIYQLIDGERRLRCHTALIEEGHPIKGIVAEIAKSSTKEDKLIMDSFLKNTGENFNPMEEGILFNKLISVYNWTPEDVSAETGKSLSIINNRLHLLNASKGVQEAVLNKEIGVTTATDIIRQSNGDTTLQDAKIEEIKAAGKDIVAEEKKAKRKEDLRNELKKEVEDEIKAKLKAEDYPRDEKTEKEEKLEKAKKKAKEISEEDKIQDIDEEDPLDEGEDSTPEIDDTDEIENVDLDVIPETEDNSLKQIINVDKWRILLEQAVEDMDELKNGNNKIKEAYLFGRVQTICEVLNYDIYEHVDETVIDKYMI